VRVCVRSCGWMDGCVRARARVVRARMCAYTYARVSDLSRVNTVHEAGLHFTTPPDVLHYLA